MIGCLQALQQRYAEAGSQLLILHGNPVEAIPALAVALNAKAVFWNWDVEPYAQERDRIVISLLKEQGIEFLDRNWDQILHTPEEIYTGGKSPYTVYTPFWKNWSSKPNATLKPAPKSRPLKENQSEKDSFRPKISLTPRKSRRNCLSR